MDSLRLLIIGLACLTAAAHAQVGAVFATQTVAQWTPYNQPWSKLGDCWKSEGVRALNSGSSYSWLGTNRNAALRVYQDNASMIPTATTGVKNGLPAYSFDQSDYIWFQSGYGGTVFTPTNTEAVLLIVANSTISGSNRRIGSLCRSNMTDFSSPSVWVQYSAVSPWQVWTASSQIPRTNTMLVIGGDSAHTGSSPYPLANPLAVSTGSPYSHGGYVAEVHVYLGKIPQDYLIWSQRYLTNKFKL
jgi:hypothetical protein